MTEVLRLCTQHGVLMWSAPAVSTSVKLHPEPAPLAIARAHKWKLP